MALLGSLRQTSFVQGMESDFGGGLPFAGMERRARSSLKLLLGTASIKESVVDAFACLKCKEGDCISAH